MVFIKHLTYITKIHNVTMEDVMQELQEMKEQHEDWRSIALEALSANQALQTQNKEIKRKADDTQATLRRLEEEVTIEPSRDFLLFTDVIMVKKIPKKIVDSYDHLIGWYTMWKVSELKCWSAEEQMSYDARCL